MLLLFFISFRGVVSFFSEVNYADFHRAERMGNRQSSSPSRLGKYFNYLLITESEVVTGKSQTEALPYVLTER